MGDKSPKDSKKNMKPKASAKAKPTTSGEPRPPEPKVIGRGPAKG